MNVSSLNTKYFPQCKIYLTFVYLSSPWWESAKRQYYSTWWLSEYCFLKQLTDYLNNSHSNPMTHVVLIFILHIHKLKTKEVK